MTNETTGLTPDNQQEKEQLKRRLYKYQDIKKEKQDIAQRLADIEAALYHPKITRLTGMPAASSGGSAMEELATRHIELLQLYREKLQELYAEQLAIERVIDSLEPTARLLMRYRYLDRLTWEEVCVKLAYSWRQTHRLHNRALNALLEKTT